MNVIAINKFSLADLDSLDKQEHKTAASNKIIMIHVSQPHSKRILLYVPITGYSLML